MTAFENRYWTSRDDLRLHYRDYPGNAAVPPVLCLPGLTRNARDFEALAERLSGTHRVLCPDLRGRGESDYARESSSYNPLQYVEDIELLLAHEGLTRAVFIGTSLGGLLTAILAVKHPGLVAGAVIDDIGPVIEPAGLDRIAEYVGQGRSFQTWMHAARALEEVQAAAYPAYELSDWLAMAKRVMVLGQNGRIVFDYDMRIAEPFAARAEQPALDLWPAFEALGKVPLLAVRGELSDLLSAETFAEMGRRLPSAELLTVPGVGHAPTLDEPGCVAAIARLLDQVA